MPHSLPTGLESWRTELGKAFAIAEASLPAGENTPDDQVWHHLEDQAVSMARVARGLPTLGGDSDTIDRTIDAITDLTERLRRHGGGDPEDHHISAEQFFLLYYLGAQVHAAVLDEAVAGEIIRGCWADAREEDEDDEVDEPWPITRPPPKDSATWLDEVLEAWRGARRPPPLRTAEGRPVLASGDDLRESGVILALHRRGCNPPAESVYGLIGVITEMEGDIEGLGPELTQLKKTPPMAFVLYYVWTHILIGHADEAAAMAVVQEASSHIDRFAPSQQSQAGSSRFKRRN